MEMQQTAVPLPRTRQRQSARQEPQMRYFATAAALPPADDGLSHRVTDVEGAVNRIEIAIARMETLMPTRKDIQDAVASRVELSTYTVAQQAVQDRLARLEGSPQRMLGWVSLLVSGGIGCVMALLTAFSVTVAVAAIIVTILLHH